jgi:hypothetical protein
MVKMAKFTNKTNMKAYRKIEDLPAWNYIEMNKNKDIRYLLKLNDYDTLPDLKKWRIGAKITENELNEISENIGIQVAQFEIDNSKLSRLILEKSKSIMMRVMRLEETKHILNYLALEGYDDFMIKQLAIKGYKINQNEGLFSELTRISKALKNETIKINHEKEELNQLTGGGDIEQKQADYEKIHLVLSKYVNEKQFALIDLKTISTKHYLIIKNNYSKQIDSVKNGKR